MIYKQLVCTLALVATSLASAQTMIECKRESKSVSPVLWPNIYLSPAGHLCFDVRGTPEFRGANCAANGQSIYWEAVTIVMIKDESQGRDTTRFRVLNPVVTDDQLHYSVEWSRGTKWQLQQRIKINRLTGEGIEYFADEHGGAGMNCRRVTKKL